MSNSPTLFSARQAYFPCLIFIPWDKPVIYLTVPWYDENPAVLEQYKADRAAGICGNSNYDALIWQPPAEATELKAWEFEKAIDEWNEHIAKATASGQ